MEDPTKHQWYGFATWTLKKNIIREISGIAGSRTSKSRAEADDWAPEVELWLRRKEGRDCPKEIAYMEDMQGWNKIAKNSPQTEKEMELCQKNAPEIVKPFENGDSIVEIGCSNSEKCDVFIEALGTHTKGKRGENDRTFEQYVGLDLDGESLERQKKRLQDRFNNLSFIGLKGTFDDGDRYYRHIPRQRLFLSLGSCLLNGPDDICDERLKAFALNLGPHDHLVIGQDGIIEGAKDPYATKDYLEWQYTSLEAVHRMAGIRVSPKEAWDVRSVPASPNVEDGLHFFKITAKQDLTCGKYLQDETRESTPGSAEAKYKIRKGTEYRLFKSWKRTRQWMEDKIKSHGLRCRTFDKVEGSEMRQYHVWREWPDMEMTWPNWKNEPTQEDK